MQQVFRQIRHSAWLGILFSLWVMPVFSQAPKKIVFLGDSLTAGYGVAKEEAFPARLEEKFKKSGKTVQVINAGISGSTSASGVSRLKWLLKNKPDILVLALGANDGLRGFKLEATKQNLEQMIELARENKLKVVLAGMQLPLNYGDDYRNQFQQMYKELAKKYKVELIPFLLEGVGGETNLNLSDGIHPNAKGHEKIAETVYQHLKGLL